MPTEKMGYHSFLLRLWFVKQNGEISWRISLENPHTGQQCFFTSLDALDEFLQQLSCNLENEMV